MLVGILWMYPALAAMLSGHSITPTLCPLLGRTNSIIFNFPHDGQCQYRVQVHYSMLYIYIYTESNG